MSTVHRVKGREWPRVAVVGVTAGLLPHRLAADEEEERRVLHVAVTRARQQVVVLGDDTRPSPFLAELTGAAPHRPERPIRSVTAPAAAGGGTGSSRRSEGGRAAAGPALEGEALDREERLKAWRRERSRADGVPAYVVASDATLRAIAERAPASSAELARVRHRAREAGALRRRHPGAGHPGLSGRCRGRRVRCWRPWACSPASGRR